MLQRAREPRVLGDRLSFAGFAPSRELVIVLRDVSLPNVSGNRGGVVPLFGVPRRAPRPDVQKLRDSSVTSRSSQPQSIELIGHDTKAFGDLDGRAPTGVVGC